MARCLATLPSKTYIPQNSEEQNEEEDENKSKEIEVNRNDRTRLLQCDCILLLSWNIGDGGAAIRHEVLRDVLLRTACDVHVFQESTWVPPNLVGHLGLPGSIYLCEPAMEVMPGRWLSNVNRFDLVDVNPLQIEDYLQDADPGVANLLRDRCLLSQYTPENSVPKFCLANIHFRRHQQWETIGQETLQVMEHVARSRGTPIVMCGDLNIPFDQIDAVDLPQNWTYVSMPDPRLDGNNLDHMFYYNPTEIIPESQMIEIRDGQIENMQNLAQNQDGLAEEGIPVPEDAQPNLLNHPLMTAVIVGFTEQRN